MKTSKRNDMTHPQYARDMRKQRLIWRARLAAWLFVLIAAVLTLVQPSLASGTDETMFRRVPTQFIAALGDPNATAGTGAQTWGLWRQDPGPRGVWLNKYSNLQAAGGMAPAMWQFDKTDWWLDENGLIMEKPVFSVPPGKYVVTGDRETVSVLTVHPGDESGDQRWELGDGATLFDVTHLPCRTARYTSTAGYDSCSPAKAQMTSFPVTPGGLMPAVEGCNKQDYAVLFIIGVAVDN